KPGETFYLKGWVRNLLHAPAAAPQIPTLGQPVAYTITDSRGAPLAKGTATLSPQGGFDLSAKLPKNANLGGATVTLTTNHATHSHWFRIEEFRTPAYSVALEADLAFAGSQPVFVGDQVEMRTEASYYGGGKLAGAALLWDATLTGSSFTPPGWCEFSFQSSHRQGAQRSTNAVNTNTALGADSANTAQFGITSLHDNRPALLRVTASVTDVDRMTIRASARSILVHPAALYVGLRAKRDVDDTVEVIVTDLDGTPVPNQPVALTIEGRVGYSWDRAGIRIVDTQHCNVVSKATPVSCNIKPIDDKTRYLVSATITDALGRPNSADFEMPWWTPQSQVVQFSARVDKDLYRAGDKAKLAVFAKDVPANATLTISKDGIVSERQITLQQQQTTIEIPIESRYLPNVHVDIECLQRVPVAAPNANLPPHIQRFTESLELRVDIESARLDVRTRALTARVAPGADATFEAVVKRGGKPVANAEVALIVVDEAILAAAGAAFEDPLAPFYPDASDRIESASTIGLLAYDDLALQGEPGVSRRKLEPDENTGYGFGAGSLGSTGSGAGGGFGIGGGIVAARSDFRANALFAPTLKTDANGVVRTTVKMPENLTRFRIVALASSETGYFGKGENAITVQRPLNIRAVAPRFLVQGDRVAVPFVVQNLTDNAATINVAAHAANLKNSGARGKRITIAAGERAEVRLDFATAAQGNATISAIAQAGTDADAVTVTLPVYAPATTEAFAVYGTTDAAPQFERLAVPKDIFQDVGGLDVSMAATEMQSLVDGFYYLYRYPFECAEQRSARMLATAALYDILDSFNVTDRPTRDEISATLKRDIETLSRSQRTDGGWGYFPGYDTDIFVTTQVLDALVANQATGAVLDRAKRFVAAELNTTMRKLQKLPVPLPIRDQATARFLVGAAAYQMQVLSAAGNNQRNAAATLHALASTLNAYPVDAQARLLTLVAKQPNAAAMRTELLARLLSASHETAGNATVASAALEGERLLLPSDAKSTGLALTALLAEVPDHTMIPKLARGELGLRRGGRWMTTQENVAALRAMRRYFDVYEKVTPQFTAQAWLGSTAYTEATFAGRTTTTAQAHVAWPQLPAGNTDVALV
ncbi:MAG TPA: alpha-2-macroglobulin family protein, partial [Kofleriaceae bacterium]|nr:alpha-2-macroglobulin family protein [Kofleriaceae bacterium]